ncbi:MAG: hypothetical protein HY721_17820 [Planctomycetes bacterium]|nr:hypothetical protein [Planctomycetota bacterium]
MGAARIAPLWADLVTSEGDIYIDEQLDSVTFRWFGRGYHTDGGVDFECELFADGTIRFGYGDGNGGLSPTIGVSAGDGQRFLISELSGRESLSQAPSVFLYPARLPDGLQVDAPTGRIAGTPSEVAQTEVAFVAEDFLGQRDELRCFFTVRPDGLAVESPREGDLWLKGSQQAVRWQWYGNAGARVRIDYNLDGSASVFPLAVAAGVPLSSRSFEWTLPAVPAPAARVRVRSLERPEIFATSGVFSIAGPTLLLASPRGGERWISGTRASVRWSSLGDTGPRVRVRYNTDGSTARFPLTLAGDAPNTGLLEVAVPATPSETCRLLIESASDPSASAASPGVFAIRAPSLTVRSPNGGECLRSGATVTVTWASEGVEAQEVLLDYNLDGGAAVFPFPLGSGRFPNTGSAPWTVPAVTTAAARLRIQSAVGPGLSDASDTPFAIAPRCELRVLAWVPYIDPAEQQVLGVQEAFARLEPGAELVLSTATAPGALRADLEGKEALVVLKQKQGPGVDFAALGRSLAEVFTEHIEAGGALVVCEQVPESEDLLRAMGLLDFQLLGEGSRLCETAEPLHPIASGVRPNFSGPRNTGWYAVRDPDAVHVVTVSSEGEREGTVVAARDVGFGRLALVGFDYFNSNDAAARILVNAARVPLAEPGVRLTAPVPRSVYLEGAEVLLRWVAAGDAQGPVRISYNLTGSSIEFPLEISASAGEGARGRLSWAAPPVPEGASYLAIRIRVESLAAPRHSAVLAEPLFVIRPLAVVTASLPEGTVGAPYRAQLSARGGVPPYHFDAEGLPAGLVIQDAGGAGAEIVGTPQAACAACQVSVAVTDSLGLTARASIPLPIVVRQITLVRPRGGELWLFGSTQEIQWTVSGDIGPTVNIGFNTDGSTTEFPFTIAEAAPAREPFLWELPPVTAPRCRLRVASNEHPSVFAVSRREISIVGPTIRLDVPNGGECWEPGKRKAIRWTSAGNPGGTVRIEYAPDGSLDEFPVLVAEAAPDTGDHAWTVPQEPAEEARVRVSFNVAPEVRDASDLPFRIGSGCKLSALLWSPCPGAEAAAEVVLGGLREREPDLEAEAAQVRRADVLAGLLANRDALAVLLTTTCDGVDPERLGREARPLLEGFVQAGGAVLLCGPTTATSRLLVGLGLLEKPLTVIASQAGLPCDVASVLHPGVSGVPLEFAGPEATMPYFETGPGFETLVRARGFPVVASRDDGPGRWTLLGFTFQALEPASARLLANAARPRPAGPGLRLLSPRPGAVFVAGEAVPVEWAARGGRSGTVRVLADLDGSGEFRHLAGEAAGSGDGGRLGWTAPAPEAGKFLTVRLEVRWADAPELPARSEGPFHITAEPLSIVTEALAGGYYLAEYSSEVRAAGGAPPYLFEAEGLPAGLILTSPDPGSAASAVTGRPLKTGSDLSVRIVVRDFLGSRAERTLRMEVLPSRIEILAPAGGEHILAGAPYEVRWRVHGYAGETLRVEYNVTGSTRIFQDEPIAAEVPAASSVSWTVPSIESATCMLRISGNDVRLSTVSDRPFAVSPPRIACLFPDGGEALETGTTRTIRWRSLGNPGGRVRIDLSLDAADEPAEYPIAVAEDAPDTGVFPWPVPRAASEACRVRIRSTSDPLLEDASAAPFAIRHVTPVRGLVWVPATGFGELEVRGAVAAVTLHENDFDWALSKAATPEALAAELVGKEAFLMVQQLPAPNLSFKALGRSLGPVLEDFARRGGTVVVLKQTGAALDFLPATGLLRPVELGRGFDVPCRVVFPGHPVVNQVPESFSARSATAWYDVPGDGVEVYAAAAGGAAGAVVAGRDLGDGRVVLVGFDYRDYTVASARVIANATRNTRHVERPRFVRGDANADGITDVSDAIFLVDFLYRGGRAPPCMDAADVDDSAVPGSPRPAVGLNDPVYLLRWLFLGGPDPPAPSPRAMPPQTCGPDRQFRDELGCDAYPPCGG